MVIRSDTVLFFLVYLQMADAMEMMILSILSPALHCDWQIASWKQALITTVKLLCIVLVLIHTI